MNYRRDKDRLENLPDEPPEDWIISEGWEDSDEVDQQRAWERYKEGQEEDFVERWRKD